MASDQLYFWNLDSDVPVEDIVAIKDALRDRKDSALKRWVNLLQARVPVLPKAYVTSAFSKSVPAKIPDGFAQQLDELITRFERLTHSSFGGRDNPLLLNIEGDYSGSVRNIGVTPAALPGLAHRYGAWKAYAIYIDFLESYSATVLGCPYIDFRAHFEIAVDREGGPGGLLHVSEEQFSKYVKQYQELVSAKTHKPFPESPAKHLLSSLIQCAYTGKQAGGDELFITVRIHRSIYGQALKGVAYSRNPFTGQKDVYGVYRFGSEGKKALMEPELNAKGQKSANPSLREKHPEIYAAVKKHLPAIETAFRNVVEAEFLTDEDGRLYFSSFDKAETTARATAIASLELCVAGIISDKEAALRISPSEVEVLLHPTLDDESRTSLKDLGSTGTTAAPGTAIGHVFFKMADAMEFYKKAIKNKSDKRVILIADELLISDTPGIGMINGLVTRASGIASHAAVMARANGIPCVVGYKGIEFDEDHKSMTVNGNAVAAGTLITVEADKEGRIYIGEGRLHDLSYQDGIVRDISQLVTRVIKQERIPLEIRANINNAKDAEVGLKFGADGVGLCRTENMFMEAEALCEIRNVIFSGDPESSRASLAKLEEYQYGEFRKIFETMRGRVVNIRLMDLPLNDFVPQTQEAFDELASQLKHVDKAKLWATAEGLKEHNPMLGLRACRFGLINPGVYDMQIRAIIRAAYSVAEQGIEVDPGIMFPLVFIEEELRRLKERVIKIEEEIREGLRLPFSKKIKIRVGTMIELPAAAMAADQLARIGEFFAFGTNDLTQTTLGISRDDSAHYLPFYMENGILPIEPFKVLTPPVRELLEMAVRRGKRVRPDARYGICGEQGGDRGSLQFCMEKGLDYVSCSPQRVLPVRTELVHVALNGFLEALRKAPDDHVERREKPRVESKQPTRPQPAK